MTVCFSGHRKIYSKDIEKIKNRIMEEIKNLYQMGARTFIAGGATGFDMLAETCVLALRHTHPDIKLILALPCKNQDKSWNDNEKLYLYNIKVMADDTIYVNEQYFPGCMMARNKYMVDNSEICLCYLDGRLKGGTYNTVKYALEQNKKIINVYG